jgi:hypothetical protein
MTNEQIMAYATLLLVLVTAAGVLAGFVFYRRQCNAQVFLEYTKRYSEIMNMFPPDSRRARFDLFAEPPDASEDLTLAVLKAIVAVQQKQIEALTAGLQKVSAQLELNKLAPKTVKDND